MQLNNSPPFPHLLFYEVWPPPPIEISPDWEHYSDEKLLMLYQTGNEQQSNDAFSAIYNRYREDIARYVASVMESENEARDVFCDVWTKAAPGLKEFTWQGISPKNWLIRTAKFTARTLKRQKKGALSFDELAEDLQDVLTIDPPCLCAQGQSASPPLGGKGTDKGLRRGGFSPIRLT